MKIITLLTLVVVALSSCATKNYLVGSANDRNRPAKHPGEDAVKAMAAAEAARNGQPIQDDKGIRPWSPVGNGNGRYYSK
jgi:hypothetical protein